MSRTVEAEAGVTPGEMGTQETRWEGEVRSSFGTEPRFLKLLRPTFSWGSPGRLSGVVISGTKKPPLERAGCSPKPRALDSAVS